MRSRPNSRGQRASPPHRSDWRRCVGSRSAARNCRIVDRASATRTSTTTKGCRGDHRQLRHRRHPARRGGCWGASRQARHGRDGADIGALPSRCRHRPVQPPRSSRQARARRVPRRRRDRHRLLRPAPGRRPPSTASRAAARVGTGPASTSPTRPATRSARPPGNRCSSRAMSSRAPTSRRLEVRCRKIGPAWVSFPRKIDPDFFRSCVDFFRGHDPVQRPHRGWVALVLRHCGIPDRRRHAQDIDRATGRASLRKPPQILPPISATAGAVDKIRGFSRDGLPAPDPGAGPSVSGRGR